MIKEGEGAGKDEGRTLDPATLMQFLNLDTGLLISDDFTHELPRKRLVRFKKAFSSKHARKMAKTLLSSPPEAAQQITIETEIAEELQTKEQLLSRYGMSATKSWGATGQGGLFFGIGVAAASVSHDQMHSKHTEKERDSSKYATRTSA